MTTAALAQGRNPINRPLSNVALPLAAGAPKAWQGARMYLDVAAAAVRPGIAGNANLFFAGDAQQTVDNSGGASTTPILVRLPDELNCEWCDNSAGNPVVAAGLFGLCYVDSDHSVSSAASGPAGVPNSVAGRVWAIDSQLGVLVQPLMGLLESYLGEEAPVGGNPAFKVRAVVTTLSGAYTGSGTGTLQASANAAFGTQDGVATLAVGDVVLLPEGTTNITASKDAGAYVISAIGAAGTKWTLTRPSWWPTSGAIALGQVFEVGGEGTLFGSTQWKATCGKGKIVDTDAPLLYPARVVQSLTLAASTIAMTNVPILSANSGIDCNLTGGTPIAGTIGYGTIAAPTPGAIGTATATIVAQASGMAKNGTTDTGKITATLTNW